LALTSQTLLRSSYKLSFHRMKPGERVKTTLDERYPEEGLLDWWRLRVGACVASASHASAGSVGARLNRGSGRGPLSAAFMAGRERRAAALSQRKSAAFERGGEPPDAKMARRRRFSRRRRFPH
jgi:hypothetical protein